MTYRFFQVRDTSIFASAVIDAKAFARIRSYIELAKSGDAADSGSASLVFGGTCDDSVGYFVEPTCIQITDPARSRLFTEEVFGPVLAVYVYEGAKVERVLASVKDATPYGLTGAVFSKDK